MQNGNVKLKLTHGQLETVWRTVGNESAVGIKYTSMEEKLLFVNLIAIAKKLNAKWFMPLALNSISLTPSEALAFWLIYNDVEFKDPFQLATMRAILDGIHKRFF